MVDREGKLNIFSKTKNAELYLSLSIFVYASTILIESEIAAPYPVIKWVKWVSLATMSALSVYVFICWGVNWYRNRMR